MHVFKKKISVIIFAVIAIIAICGSYIVYVKKIKYKNTNIIRIEEGIGNQLYQYAFGYLLEKKYGMKVLYQNNINENDARVWVRYGLDKFNINVKLFEPNFIEKLIIGKKKDINNLLLKDKILYAKNHDFKSFYLTYFDASLLEGYEKDFQDMFLTLSPKYKNELDDKNKAMIKAGHTKSVMLNANPADIIQAVNSVIHSKTFDNGMICASEQSVIVLDKVYDAVKKEFTDRGCYSTAPSTPKS